MLSRNTVFILVVEIENEVVKLLKISCLMDCRVLEIDLDLDPKPFQQNTVTTVSQDTEDTVK